MGSIYEACYDDTLRLFFNKQGAVCCHGYGYIKVSEYRNKDDFLEYSLDCKGQAEKKRCVVIANDNGVECDLKQVSCIYEVMKAFLESPYVYESTRFGEIIKAYKLHMVIMPEEYKKLKYPQYWISCAAYSGYLDDYRSDYFERY